MANFAAMSVSRFSSRAVAIWIYIGVFMLLVQVILGGVTRLTGSGLSITEWNVVTGTLPPLSENEWREEFQKYQLTPQYQILNTGFTLSDFKFIFFWEWLHRFWARMIGVVFIVGFVYLIARKQLKKEMQLPLLILFFLGAFQGLIGWIMVVSGLTGDATYVKPTRLALHFIFALILIAYAYWFSLKLSIPEQERIQHRPLRNFTSTMIVLVMIQFIFGALMAGHKAALAAPTWPDINGSIIPSRMFHKGFLRSLIENKITVHFFHRGIAYLLLIISIFYTIKLYRYKAGSGAFRKARIYPMILISVQLLLGIFSVLTARGIIPNQWGIFEWMAQLHQIVGMLLLLSFIHIYYLCSGNPVLRSYQEPP